MDYRIEHGPKRALVIPVREKATGPDYLRFGLGLAADFEDEAFFNALISYRRTWLNRTGAEWLTELQFGRSTYLFSEFYQPLLRRGGMFVSAYGQVGRDSVGVFEGDDRVAEYRVSEGRIGVDLGAEFGTWAELRLGVLKRRLDARVATGSAALPELDITQQGVRLRLFGDRLDAPWFPRSGQRLALGGFQATESSDGVPRYRRVEGEWVGAATFGRHTGTLTLAAGTPAGTELPAYEAFSLGGPFRLSGYRIGQFAGQQYTLGALRYYNQRVRLPTLLGSGAYIGAALEVGRMNRLFGVPPGGAASTGTLWSTSLFLASETFLGPGFLGIGYGGSGRTAVYLILGGL